jgi:hypothetical protein
VIRSSVYDRDEQLAEVVQLKGGVVSEEIRKPGAQSWHQERTRRADHMNRHHARPDQEGDT